MHKKTEQLAFDRASVRTIDVDGRMHVAMSNISMAAVNPYLGSEIPGAESLGLDPDRVYQLLRDPGELAKAASTFNSVPVLSRHVPVSVDDHKPDLVVGSTGTDAVFETPYLRNSMVIWAAIAIDGIESGEQRELSCAYRYVPDMTPGVYEGTPYQGRMTNIQANHLALVPVGRAGPSVIVGDKSPFLTPTEQSPMKNPKRIAALTAALVASLAQDAAMKPEDIAKRLSLALDAESEEDEKDDKADKKKPAFDGDEQGEGESDESYEKRMDEKKAKAEASEADKKDDKAAMDAAIKSAVSAAETATVKRMNAIRQAEAEVKPLIGEVVAQDSAEAVYKLALDAAGVDLTGVPAAAFGAMVRMLAKPAEKSPRVAMDAASVTEFATMFPTAGKVTRS